MSIRFSPGCECCGNRYVFVCKALNLGLGQLGTPNTAYDRLLIGTSNGNVAIAGPGSNAKPYTLIASSNDIDLKEGSIGMNVATFVPIGSILPLLISQVGTSSLLITDVPTGNLGMTAQLAASGSSFQFWAFQVSGAKGSWEILNSQTKIAGDPNYVFGISVNFTINPNGSISP